MEGKVVIWRRVGEDDMLVLCGGRRSCYNSAGDLGWFWRRGCWYSLSSDRVLKPSPFRGRGSTVQIIIM